MDTKAEQESVSRPETVKLDQDFQILKANRTRTAINEPMDGVKEFKSAITLDVSDEADLPKIKLEIGLYPSRVSRYCCLTPFDPKLGYEITGDDFDIKKRFVKVSSNREDLEKNIDFNKAPLFLALESNEEATEKLGFLYLPEQGVFKKIKPEVRATLERLRFQVVIPVLDQPNRPTQIFEARLDMTSLNIRRLYFHNFYPLDTGPLAKLTGPSSFGLLSLEEGLFLYLPSDYGKLKHLQGRFHLDKNGEKEEIPEGFLRPSEKEPDSNA